MGEAAKIDFDPVRVDHSLRERNGRARSKRIDRAEIGLRIEGRCLIGLALSEVNKTPL